MQNFRIVLLSIAAFAVLTATHANALQAQAVPAQAPLQTVPPTVTPQPQQIQTPSFIPLATDHVVYVDKVLSYWQQRTEKVHLYRTKFQRWQFDTVFGPANTFKTFSTGKIQYAEPDKGLFKVEEVLSYHAPVGAATKPSYKAIPGVHGEYWVCDGKSIFEYDYNNQKVIQQVLPAELQGKNIINGPLPFLFGANAADIKRRFWVRAITSPTAKKEIWLEAYPKSAQDASNYQRIHIIINTDDFLPKGLVIFDRSYVKGKNHSRTVFSFQDRDVNFASAFDKLNPFFRNFYEPAVPAGWKKVVHAAPTARPTTRQATQDLNTPR